MTQEEEFALMLREVLVEYDFDAIEVAPERVRVRLTREVFAADGKEDRVEHSFSDPKIISILNSLKEYLPTV